MRRSLTALSLTAVMLTGGLAAAAPASAAACQPPDGSTRMYIFQSPTKVWMKTGLFSAYLKGPGSVSYSETETAEVSAAMTAEVSAEAGVVFAQASVSLGLTVGRSFSKAQTWTYTMNVPSGKTARARLYHEGRRFTVTKKLWSTATCKFNTAYSVSTTAPVAANINLWQLEYK